MAIRFCTNCVISNRRPSSSVEFKVADGFSRHFIEFDSNGVCSACHYAMKKETEIDWDSRERELIALLDKHRRPSGYDVVIPGSGGKDSAFVSHLLKYKYGMNPITVTWSPHLYTDIGRRNFDSWITQGGFDNILITPNGRIHRLLTSLSFKRLLHPFQPFILGQKMVGPKMAQLLGISLVFYGENQAEYGNKIEDNLNPRMDAQFYNSHSNIMLGGLTKVELKDRFQFRESDFEPYTPLDLTSSKRIETHFMSYYVKWDPQECFYYASANTGFQPNDERTQGSYSKYSSIDDKIDPFHYYTTLVKFGLGRASYDAAQEIRNGKITRDEGVELVRLYDQEFPEKYFSDFLEYIDVTESEFWEVIDSCRPGDLWEKKNEKWYLKHAVWM